MQRDYVNYILPYIKDFKYVQLSILYRNEIKLKCIKLLNYKNESELKQKHEGFTFYDSFSRDILGIIAIKKYLNLLKKNEILTVRKDFLRTIKINSNLYNVVVFDHGQVPRIPVINTRNIIFVIRNSDTKYLICGYANQDCLNANQSRGSIQESIYNLGFTGFIGFSNLIDIDMLK